MSSFKERLKNIGPGALIAAGFIGPGTVTTATVSGANYGYTLLWAMLFSIFATIVLQEMSGRLGVVTQKGLGENLREKFTSPALKSLTIVLVVSAIFIGNIAYETGNVAGGVMGLESILPNVPTTIWPPLLGILAFLLLWSGNYKHIEKFFIGIVLVMSALFVTTALIISPNWGEVIRSLFIPRMPETDQAWFTVIGLIGTTIVPYNLFLHASSTSKKWHNKEHVKTSRLDTILAISLGGIISMAVIIVAAAAFYGTGTEITNAGQMATQLEPILGSWATWFFGIGLLAAGFTSTITAPLSAAYAVGGILGWGNNLKEKKIRIVWIIVLVVGITLASLGQSSPVEIILFAQAANALILPIIAIFLTITLNDKTKMGEYRNTPLNNILAGIVIFTTIAISVRSFSLFFAQLTNILGL